MNRALHPLAWSALLAAALPAQQPAPLPPAMESYVAHLAAAEGAVARGATGAAWRWLDAVPAAERRFEWHLLAAEAEQSLAAHALHAPGLSCVAVSPDSATCAVGTVDGTILLFDTAALADPSRAPTPRRSIAAHRHSIYCLSFDADGKRLASSSADRGAAIWDVATGASLATFGNHTYPVTTIRFAPDGQRMCSTSYQRPKGGEIRIWNAADGKELAVLQSGYAPITCSHWSADGKHIVGASWDQQLHVFDLAAPDRPIVVRLGAEGPYRAAQASALSPDGTLVAVACKDDQIHLFEAWTGKPVRDFVGHGKIVEGVAFSPDGKLLASTSADTSVRLWDVASGKQVAMLRGHRGLVRGVTFAQGGTRLLTCSADGTVRAWDVAAARHSIRRIELPKNAYSVAERPDGKFLALGDAEGALLLRSTADGSVVEQIADDDGWIGDVHWRRDTNGDHLLLAAGNRLLQRWDLGTKTRRLFGDPKVEPPRHGCGGGIDAVAWSPDGTRIAAVCRDNQARAWDAATGQMLWKVDFPKTPLRIVFAPDGSALAIAGQAGVALHDPADGAVRVALKGHRGTVQSVQFAPDGNEVVTVGEDGTLRFWNSADGTLLASTVAHDGPARRVAMSPDGTRLATCGDDDRIVLWDTATRAAVWSRDLKDGYCLSWSHDGRRLWVLTLGKELLCLDAGPVVQAR